MPLGLKRIAFSLLIVLIASLNAYAQLQVENTATVQQLVSNVLLGEGVELSHVTYNHGSANMVRRQVGYFSGGAPHIGIDRGLIIATGGVEVAEGPNNIPTAHVPVPQNEQLNADADLSQLIGINNLRDVAIIQFDFKAKGDTLRFRYVFASEEYNDHTCSPYNDAFGFFISGPGIQGNPNFSNTAKNVALVPGTHVPVAINTVNQGFAGMYGANAVCNAVYNNWQANSVYFVNNANNTDPGTTQFDGFTVPFLIEVPVICGETYHIKIAIADAIDDKNDSAVFIEAESFSSEILVDASLEVINPEEGNDSLALEGCSAYRLHVSRTDSVRAKTLYLRTHNLPNRPIVLPDLPAELHFAAGEAAKTIEFSTANDGLHQGTRQWELHILQAEACGQDTAIFAVQAAMTDRPPLQIEAPESVFVACHSEAAVSITLQGGNPPYAYTWSDTSFQSLEIHVSADTPAQLELQVEDACNLHQLSHSIVVVPEDYDSLSVSAPASFHFDCVNPVALEATAQGGVGEFSYQWWYADEVIGSEASIEHLFSLPGTLSLEVSDRCAGTSTVHIQANLLANPVVVELGDDLEGSCLDPVMLLPEVIGGFGELSYTWHLNDMAVHTEPIFHHTPERTVRVSLKVEDQCGQADADTLFIFVNDPDLEVYMPTDTTVCVGERVELRPSVSGAIGELVYHWPYTGGSLETYSYLAREPASFKVEVKDACGRSSQAETQIAVSEVFAEFGFDYDFPENGIRNYSSPASHVLWSFPDGSTSDHWEPVYLPEPGSNAPVMLELVDDFGCSAQAVEFFDPPMDVFIPTAFTPDGNGRNDQFKAVGRYVESWHLLIFDKWGHLIFESRDINEGWDGSGTRREGQLSTDNIYPYRYVARSWSGEVREGKGSVLLLR